MNMTPATAAKFTFDLDLTQRTDKARSVGERELADMLADAEQKAYARGLADGEATSTAKSADTLAKAIDTLATRTAEIAQSADTAQRELLTDASNLAVATARKLAANLIARRPLEEIRHLMDECLGTLGNVPHLVIRCHPDIADAIKQTAESKIQASGFEGRLVVLGEPDIMLGDARFEWVDGGLVRDLGVISAEIDRKLSEFIEANGTSKAKEPAQ